MSRPASALVLLAAALLAAGCGPESVPLSDDQLPIARVDDRTVTRGLYEPRRCLRSLCGHRRRRRPRFDLSFHGPLARAIPVVAPRPTAVLCAGLCV